MSVKRRDRGFYMPTPVIVAVILIGTAIAVIVGFIVASGNDTTVRDAGEAPGYTPPPPVKPLPAAVGIAPLPKHPRVLIIGDSFTYGLGADVPTDGWAYKVGAPLGWDVTVDGRSGSGYLNSAPNAPRYLVRVKALARPCTASLVVLQGSQNDAALNESKLPGAIGAVVAALKGRCPKAQILFLTPISQTYTPSQGVVADAYEIKRWARLHRYPVIDPVDEDWINRENWDQLYGHSRVGGHPNTIGHAYIARRFVADVRKLLSAGQ